MDYDHTQVGTFMIVTAIVVGFLFLFMLVDIGFDPAVVPFLAVAFVMLLSFVSLRVRVTETDLKLKFGFGLFRRTFPLADIASAKPARNKWYWGIGIKYWMWPKLWVYSVSGLDAVEIVMKDGKVNRIGTDEPEELAEALNRALR